MYNKIKATKKEMKHNYKILGVGYCAMQSLLAYEQAVAYSAGRNGWACDYYYVDGVVISTGYSPISSKNMRTDYALIREYENKAREARDATTNKRLLRELLKKMQDVTE